MLKSKICILLKMLNFAYAVFIANKGIFRKNRSKIKMPILSCPFCKFSEKALSCENSFITSFLGIYTNIGENDLEMFSAAQFFQQSIKNSLNSASWGVSDINISYQSGVDEDSLTELSFPSLVPGNEITIAGRLEGDGESIIKVGLSYTALGSEQMSFIKYYNQAASKLDNGPLWDTFSIRSYYNLQMTQYLDEWHKMTPKDDSSALENIIMDLSVENQLLTPFVTLHVAKPGLRASMDGGFSLADFGFRKRRSVKEKPMTYQELKFRHRGRHAVKKMVQKYEPVLCGNSELIAFPTDLEFFTDMDFVCFDPAELEFEELEIYKSENVNVKGQVMFGQLNEIYIGNNEEGVKVSFDRNGPKISHVEDHLETVLEFGSHIISDTISASRFGNYSYVYFDNLMIALELKDTYFKFEIGKLNPERGLSPSQPNFDDNKLHCFEQAVNVSKCTNHDISALSSDMPKRHGRDRKITVADFNRHIELELVKF